jgi:hypothetical protein
MTKAKTTVGSRQDGEDPYLIPTCIDHDPQAHWRRPMVMMRQG